MADLLVSTAPGSSCNLDAAWAWQQPNPNTSVLVRLSTGGAQPNNDMNWAVFRVGNTPSMWFSDAGTGNKTGPKVLQLEAKTGGGVDVVVKGDQQVQPAPAVTSWKVAAKPSTDVLALAATISQTFAGQEWFLLNEGTVPNESFAKASLQPTSWYLEPSKLAPQNLNDFLSTVIDGGSLKAGDAILRMWNGIANTGWKASLAPTLLAWQYDFSKMFLQPNATDPFDKTALENILYGGLYNKSAEYKAYFDSFAPGITPVAPPPNFGTGAPPPANPPQPPGPHRPVHRPK
jgi:hypothetical protein